MRVIFCFSLSFLTLLEVVLLFALELRRDVHAAASYHERAAAPLHLKHGVQQAPEESQGCCALRFRAACALPGIPGGRELSFPAALRPLLRRIQVSPPQHDSRCLIREAVGQELYICHDAALQHNRHCAGVLAAARSTQSAE
jgi:hypothetical protein